jgi:glucose-1-phosphate thymidylyltransferase
MKAVILAAGYATRLAPLTDHCPKALLPLADRPALDYVVRALEDCAGLDGIVLVTNDLHHDAFRSWLHAQPRRLDVVLVNDGTRTNAERLGATGDLHVALVQARVDDEFLLLSSDRIPTTGFGEFARAFWDTGEAVNACFDTGSLESVRLKHGCVQLSADGRLIGFEEKPASPRSTIISIALYRYPRKSIPLVERFLEEGGERDAPGHFLKWYLSQHPVYGYLLPEPFHDIGTFEQYRETDLLFSMRARG